MMIRNQYGYFIKVYIHYKKTSYQAIFVHNYTSYAVTTAACKQFPSPPTLFFDPDDIVLCTMWFNNQSLYINSVLFEFSYSLRCI